MKLREIMSAPPVFVYPETPLWRAARAMGEGDCEFLPVVQNGVPIGVLTMGDLLATIASDGKCPFSTYAVDVMSAPAVGLSMEAGLPEAAATMLDHRVHRLVVVDERGILRGVVSQNDLSANLDSSTVSPSKYDALSEPELLHVHQPWLPATYAA